MIDKATIMPHMMPVPIETKGKPLFKKLWVWLSARRQWILTKKWEIYCYQENRTVIVKVPAGFIFDGASVPRALWGVFSPTGILFIPSLAHDYVYREGKVWVTDLKGNTVYNSYRTLTRKESDKLFYDLNNQVNGIKPLNLLAHGTLRSFGWIAWNSNRKK